jgi:hypothetical protein
MSRWSARRGQTEPLAALAAVLVLGLALGLYADVLAAVEPPQSRSPTAGASLQRVHDAVTDDGVAVPGRLDHATGVAPPGHDLNATLSAAGNTWTVGPVPPQDAPSASRQTPVRVDRWTAAAGHLRVVVWT